MYGADLQFDLMSLATDKTHEAVFICAVRCVIAQRMCISTVNASRNAYNFDREGQCIMHTNVWPSLNEPLGCVRSSFQQAGHSIRINKTSSARRQTRYNFRRKWSHGTNPGCCRRLPQFRNSKVACFCVRSKDHGAGQLWRYMI